MDVSDQVKHKVGSIQDTIASIADVQQQLKTNCIETKSGIHSSISRQLETLRSREVWLLNQVDVIRHIKEERLQGQLACLLHELGGLQHLIQIAQSCGESCADLKQELVETLSRLKDLGDKPVEKADIKFHSDFNQLRRAVCSYGSVDAAGHTMEDYPMSESLCNSLGGLSIMDQAAACGRTQIQFPPFDTATSMSEWLAQRDTDDFVMLENDRFEIQIPPFDEQPGESKPLEEHFNEVTLSPLAEWLLDSGRFQADFSVDKTYPHVMTYFREISNDVKDWLVDYEKSQEVDMEEEKQSKECKDLCHCAGPPEGFVMQSIEIENLDQLTCMQDTLTHNQQVGQPDKNKWLCGDSENTAMESDDTPPFVLPPVKSSCRANEPCQDFTECVCDTNCAVTAIVQANPSLDQEQVLSYFQKASKNSSDWLIPKFPENPCENIQEMVTEANCQWLLGDRNMQTEYVCEFAQFNSVTTSSEWLMQKSEVTLDRPAFYSSPLDAYIQKRSDFVDDWLLKEIPSEESEMVHSKSQEYCSPYTISSPLDTYLHQRSDEVSDWLKKDTPSVEKVDEMPEITSTDEKHEKSEQWLHHTHSSESKSIDEVVKKYHAQMARSDWLKLQVQPDTKSEWLLDSSSSSSTSSPSAANIEAYKLFLRLENSGDNKEWLKE